MYFAVPAIGYPDKAYVAKAAVVPEYMEMVIKKWLSYV